MTDASTALSQITEGMTVQDLRDLASTVDVTVGNSTLLLYSGGAGEIDAQSGQGEYIPMNFLYIIPIGFLWI